MTATFPALGGGSHTIRVRGIDSAPVQHRTMGVGRRLERQRRPGVRPGSSSRRTRSNGLATVALHATGFRRRHRWLERSTSAEYTIDNGPATPMTIGGATVTTSLDATIPAGLSEGDHPITVVATDSFDNPGPAASTVLTIDKTGPTTSAVAVAPTATNGTIGVNSSTPAVRVTASATDPVSNVVAAEGFIDTVGAPGSGFIFLPVDGAWNSKTESLTVDIPLTTINALPPGTHTIYVRAKDASGNWETPHSPATALPSTTLIVDKTAPVVTSATLSPNTITPGTASVTLNVAATDALSGVAGWQYWIDGTTTPPPNPTSFTGTSATINTAALAAGSHTVNVRVKDVAGNWSAVASRPLYVALAVNDARSITASGTTGTQTSDANAGNGVLTNDQPVGVAGRTSATALGADTDVGHRHSGPHAELPDLLGHGGAGDRPEHDLHQRCLSGEPQRRREQQQPARRCKARHVHLHLHRNPERRDLAGDRHDHGQLIMGIDTTGAVLEGPVDGESGGVIEATGRKWFSAKRLVLAGFVVVSLLAAFVVWQSQPDTNAAIDGSTAITADELESQYGVRLDVVGLIASGGLIELRFQVTDADKATALFGAVEDMPVLAVEGSTAVLTSAKGMKHQLTLLDGASYFFLYTNVANAVHEGSTVAFVINGVRVPHLIVQQ